MRFLLCALMLLVFAGCEESSPPPSTAPVNSQAAAWQREYDACMESKFRVEEAKGRARDRITSAARHGFERDCKRSADRIAPR
ncbi:MAG: hypothetical protein M9925_10860 [Chloroflexi bacterium]|nr:hypothetical protein [Chloroflexota bacterium]